jgi:arsenate reductase
VEYVEMRILVLCTHNSARSQMAEGWLRKHATEAGLEAEIWSAGTSRTRLNPDAVEVMREVGVDIGGNHSKALFDIPDPWNFDLVLTVCDSANEACPSYPAKTVRLHRSFPDPSGQPLARWRHVRDELERVSRQLISGLERGETVEEHLV